MKYSPKLDHLPLFGSEVIKSFYPHLKSASFHQKMKRWLDRGELIQLKKGLYMTKEYWRAHQQDLNFSVFVANHLRYPSYVSGPYILQRHDMMTEVMYPMTSVTLKSSRTYSNALGTFVYSSISESLYHGFTTESFGLETVYVASRIKALFDFFYFKYAKAKTFPSDLLERERIDLEKLTEREKKEFRGYCKKCHRRLFHNLPFILFP